MTHWFKKICGRDADTCANRRDGKCDNPPSDCLLYELIEDESRETRNDIKEIVDENKI